MLWIVSIGLIIYQLKFFGCLVQLNLYIIILKRPKTRNSAFPGKVYDSDFKIFPLETGKGSLGKFQF